MGQSARCHFSPRRLRHLEPALSGTFQETSVDFCTSYLHFIAALALLYLFHRKAGTMPEKDFYLLVILSLITGFLLIQLVMTRIGRRRKNRRLEREILEYLRKRA